MNLFIITSPFQYICANEARLAYQLENNILLYVEQDTLSGATQMSSLFEEEAWNHVIRIPRSNRTFHVPSAIKKIKKVLGKSILTNIVFSEYFGWRSNIILANLETENYIYIDDGTTTLLEYDDYIAPNRAYNRKRILQDMAIRLQGLKPPHHKIDNNKLEIFTIFDIPDSIVPVKTNNLSALKTKISADDVFDQDAPVGLIGQACIGEKRGISISDYIKEVNAIVTSQPNGVFYFPHRTESEQVKSLLSNIKGLHYHTPKSPIELEIAQNNIKLSGIMGVTSNALYTVSKIYSTLPISVIGGKLKGNNDRDARVRNFLNSYFDNYTK